MTTVYIENQSPISLKSYMRKAYPALSGSILRKALEHRDFKINGTRAGASDILQSGDSLQIFIAESLLLSMDVDIIFEDENIIIIDKPAGLSVDSDGISRDTLLSQLQSRYPQNDIKLCHRLDHNTSGIITAAKHQSAHDDITSAFKQNRVAKIYNALVRGIPTPSSATIRAYCIKDSASAVLTVLSSPAQRGTVPLITRYSTLRAIEDFDSQVPISLMEISPVTGRTHQIRAHMAYIGHPVIGDDKYGDRMLNKRCGRREQALRAVSITFFFDSGALKYLSGRTFIAPYKPL